MNKFKERRESSIYNLRVFHNWVKRQLITDTVDYLRNNYDMNPEGINVLELSVGKAGDLMKWLDVGVQQVTGFDIDEPSIREANKRFNELINNLKRKNIKNLPNYKFYTMDLSKPDNIDKIEKIIGNHKFQIISCQFAIHYFFKNPESLDTLIRIVNKFMDSTCFFIGTTMNGDKIKEIFLKSQNIIKNDIFQITNQTSSTKLNKPYNNKYMVQLGLKSDKEHYFVDKPSEEYLVNIDELKKVCDNYNLDFIGITEFSKWYDLYLETNPKNKLTDQEKEFSFLNMSFVFMTKRN